MKNTDNDYDYYKFWSETQGHSTYQRIFSWFKKKVECLYANLLESAMSRQLAGLSLLEIGPGQGYFAAEARRRRAEYYAVEKSFSLSNALSQRNFMVTSEDFSEMTYGNKLFDVIYLSHVLEHTESMSQAVHLIQTCWKKLKVGGYLMVNTPNVLDYKFSFWLLDYTHNFVTTPLRVRNLLNDCQFTCLCDVRTVFIFKNILPRKLIQIFCRPPFSLCYKPLLHVLMKRNVDFFDVVGFENCSIIARKEEKKIMP